MVDRIERYAVTLPAGTGMSSPATTTLGFRDGVVRRIDVRVPPGPSGLMGFYVGYASGPVIPETAGTFLVMDDESWSYEVDNHPTGTQWQVTGYNTDVYDHTVYVTFHLDELPHAPASMVEVLAISPSAQGAP